MKTHRLKALASGVLPVIVALTGSACGSPTGGSNQPSPSAALGTGLGADRITWTQHHAISASTFSGVSFAADHVDGFTMHLGGDGLTEASARADAVTELPTDARLVFERRKYVGMTDPDDQCDLLQYRSTELGRVIPDDPTGVIIIQLGRLTDNGLQPYDPDHITTISILATGTLNDVPNEC